MQDDWGDFDSMFVRLFKTIATVWVIVVIAVLVMVVWAFVKYVV